MSETVSHTLIHRRNVLKTMTAISISTLIAGPVLTIRQAGASTIRPAGHNAGQGKVLSYPAPSDSALFLQHFYGV